MRHVKELINQLVGGFIWFIWVSSEQGVFFLPRSDLSCSCRWCRFEQLMYGKGSLSCTFSLERLVVREDLGLRTHDKIYFTQVETERSILALFFLVTT